MVFIAFQRAGARRNIYAYISLAGSVKSSYGAEAYFMKFGDVIKNTYPQLGSPDKILEQKLNIDTAQNDEFLHKWPLPEYVGTVHRFSIDMDTALTMLNGQKIGA